MKRRFLLTFMEFADGDQITADWCTHEPLQEAATVYATIENYLSKLTKK